MCAVPDARPVLLMMAGRSGSHWLRSHLNLHSDVFIKKELLYNMDRERAVPQSHTAPAFVYGVLPIWISHWHDACCVINECSVSGFSIRPVYQVFDRPEFMDLADAYDVRFIRLLRKNLLKKAVSQCVAKNTGIFHTKATTDHIPPMALDPSLVIRQLVIEKKETDVLVSYCEELEKRGHPALALTYEDMLDDIGGCVNRCFDFMGVSRLSVPLSKEYEKSISNDLRKFVLNYGELEKAVIAAGFREFL